MSKFFSLFLLCISLFGYSQENRPFIPKPQNIAFQNGYFEVNEKTVIYSADVNSFEALFLKETIQAKTGLDLKITSKYSKENSIQFLLQIPDTTAFNRERYQLSIGKNKVQIFSPSNHGLFYGIQTLLQYIPFQKSESLKLNCLKIVDEPKYKWRGMHLDVSRHFFGIDFIKKYILRCYIFK